MSSNKLDWSKFYRNPIERKASPDAHRATYSSGKAMLLKSFEEHLKNEQLDNNIKKALPIIENLFSIRLSKGSPLFVTRPLRYTSVVARKSMNLEMDMEITTGFENVIKTIPIGEKLKLIQLNNMEREFIFKSETTGKEYNISFDEKRNILINTDIYDIVLKYLNEETK